MMGRRQGALPVSLPHSVLAQPSASVFGGQTGPPVFSCPHSEDDQWLESLNTLFLVVTGCSTSHLAVTGAPANVS